VFAGFQATAEGTQCVPGIKHFGLEDVAKRVLGWLNVQDNWLLVSHRHLDQIEMIDKYLPDRSPSRYTLITTRYSYCDHIPAEGLKVGELGVDDATKLLLLVRKLSRRVATLKLKLKLQQLSKNSATLRWLLSKLHIFVKLPEICSNSCLVIDKIGETITRDCRRGIECTIRVQSPQPGICRLSKSRKIIAMLLSSSVFCRFSIPMVY
jgi:hypothetical protein